MANEVNRVTGDVRVNGEVVPEEDKISHVEVLPKRGVETATVGRLIKFKGLKKGFSTEVKLPRPAVQA